MGNKTPFAANNYDNQIVKTIPMYDCFHDEAIDIVKTINPNPAFWLDTGCGTGTFAEKVFSSFDDKIKLVLADPSEAMLTLAKKRLSNNTKAEFLLAGTQNIEHFEAGFGVVTAIQAHHYLNADIRKKATENCYRMLKPGGVYITFENVRPSTQQGIEIGLDRWKTFQIRQGKPLVDAEKHVKRFDVEYFPITIMSHIDVLNAVGFSTVEILWVSGMQAGFYAVK